MPVYPLPAKAYDPVTGFAWFPDAATLSLVGVAVLLVLFMLTWAVVELRDRRENHRAAVLVNLNRGQRAAVLARHL